MKITVQQIIEASVRLEGIVERTPLQYNKRLSELYNAKIYVKREDLQEIRSYKIRGAYNLMSSLTEDEKKKGVVCSSLGNHAQGVAYGAAALGIKATIFMPTIAPQQKINRVKQFGKEWAEVKLVGQTYDDAAHAAHEYSKTTGAIFVHAFDDPRTIAGQGTIGKEILEQLDRPIDYLFCPSAGGGLITGISTYLKAIRPKVKVISVQAKGAPSLYEALKQNKIVTLEKIDSFVDDAAVKRVGELPFQLAKELVDNVVLSEEGRVCSTMIELYQNEGIVAEPAGALSLSVLDDFISEIKGKTVVCILSGGNNDILRYPEIMERSLVYQGRKHYFILEFAQKPGQLKRFLNDALGSTDDIVRFEYMKKTNKEKGAALVGIELQAKKDLAPLVQRMKDIGLTFEPLTSDEPLYGYLI